MPDTTNELNEIGAALAFGASDEPVELTDKQRAALGRTTVAATLAAIGLHLPNRKSAYGGNVRKIAANWADNYRASLGDSATLQRIADAVAHNDVATALQHVVSTDSRLTDAAKATVSEALYRAGATDGDTSRLHLTQTRPAYISRIAVEGFRGIGPQTEIAFDPSPGITLVYGANGSGKSSIVEALDMLLYGMTARFRNQEPEKWRRALFNLHAPGGGLCEATFTDYSREFVLRRTWTSPSASPSGFEHISGSAADTAIEQLGWSEDLLEEFRPVLGHGETYALLEEDAHSPGETHLAKEIRLRYGVTDPWLEHLWSDTQRLEGGAFRFELKAWVETQNAIASGGSNRKYGRLDKDQLAQLRKAFTGSQRGRSMLPPSAWEWHSLTALVTNLPHELSSQIRNLISTCNEYAPRDARLPFRAVDGRPASEARVYQEMLVHAIVNARLQRLVEDASDYWSMIRPNSATRFRDLNLRRRTASLRTSKGRMPVVHATFSLSVEDHDGVERWVLSQGELQTLALISFLPAMTRPESPFAFAVIDDPVQVMDEHAVQGLARVLEDIARDIQVIVFTHDDRLPRALLRASIDHARIDVQRFPRSTVTCETLYDPVSQRLYDARSEAARPTSDDALGRRQDVADQCRRSIEAACTRAVTQRRVREGARGAEISEGIDRLKEDSKASTRRLLELAIGGDNGKIEDGDGEIKTVTEYVSENEDWGDWINETLNRVNALVHQPDAWGARNVYGGDLLALVDDVERITQKIEENCV